MKSVFSKLTRKYVRNGAWYLNNSKGHWVNRKRPFKTILLYGISGFVNYFCRIEPHRVICVLKNTRASCGLRSELTCFAAIVPYNLSLLTVGTPCAGCYRWCRAVVRLFSAGWRSQRFATVANSTACFPVCWSHTLAPWCKRGRVVYQKPSEVLKHACIEFESVISNILHVWKKNR